MTSYSSQQRTAVWWLALITISFALFGPKIGGNVVDMSVAIPATAFLIILSLGGNLSFSREGAISFSLIILIFFYILTVALVAGVPDVQMVARTARAVISTTVLGMMFFFLTSSGALRPEGYLRALVLAMMLLASAMLLQILVPQTQVYFAEIYGFNKGLRSFRAFGLTAGYDTAGYLMVFATSLALLLCVVYRSRIYLLAAIASGAAVMFSSRSSMALLALLVLITLMHVVRNDPKRAHRLVPLTIAFVSAFALYVAPIFLATIDLLGGRLLDMPNIGYDPSSNFSRSSLGGVYQSMWFLPESTAGQFLGLGRDAENTDIGYIKILFMGGWVLMTLILSFFGYTFYSASRALKSSRGVQTAAEKNSSRVLVFSLFALFLITLIGNVKNLYFLTRGYHELFIILSFSALGYARYYERRYGQLRRLCESRFVST